MWMGRRRRALIEHRVVADHHGQLESQQRQCVDCALRWRRGTSDEAGLPASQPPGRVLWQRSVSGGNFVVEHAFGHRVPVPETLARRKEDADGGAAQEVRSGAAESA